MKGMASRNPNRLEPKENLVAISDFDQLAESYPDWDQFVDSYASSPYYLLGFLGSYFHEKIAGAKLRRRFCVVMSDGNSLEGLAAFRTGDSYVLWRPRLFRFRTAQFLLADSWSPDFVARPDRRRDFVEGALSMLFDGFECRSVLLTLATDSPTVPILTNWAESRGMTIQHHPHPRHPKNAIVRVQGTWDDFLKSLGKKYIQNLRRAERRLNRAGSWRVISEKVDSQAVVDKILAVDHSSWKQELRNATGGGEDLEMARILGVHLRAPGSRFCPLVWFLELNGIPIAFALVLILGGVAYQPNASYDARFKELAPGKVLDMKMFQDLFASGLVTRLEFFTAHGYMEPWASEVGRRDTFVIENHRGPFKVLRALQRNKRFAGFARAVTVPV
jgi:hypothetical protein